MRVVWIFAKFGGFVSRAIQTKIPNYSSFSSVSVRCRRAFSFKRRLTDTCVLGNLPKTGTGFVEIHGSLREIPESKKNPPGADFRVARRVCIRDDTNKIWSLTLPIFYRSRMTGIYNSSFSSVSDRCRRASSFKRRLTDTCVLGNLPKIGTGFVEIHGSLREIPEAKKIWSLTLPIFYRSRMTGLLFLVCYFWFVVCCWFVLCLSLGSKKQ